MTIFIFTFPLLDYQQLIQVEAVLDKSFFVVNNCIFGIFSPLYLANEILISPYFCLIILLIFLTYINETFFFLNH